jgi:hypothetical protein
MTAPKNVFFDVKNIPSNDGSVQVTYGGLIRTVTPAPPAGPASTASKDGTVVLRAQHPVSLFCTNPDCASGTPPLVATPAVATLPVEICVTAGVPMRRDADCLRLGTAGSEVLVPILDAPESAGQEQSLKQLCAKLAAHRCLRDMDKHTHFDLLWIVGVPPALASLIHTWIALPRSCNGCSMSQVAAVAAAG